VSTQDEDSDFEAHQKYNSEIGGKIRTPAIDKLIKRAILLCEKIKSSQQKIQYGKH